MLDVYICVCINKYQQEKNYYYNNELLLLTADITRSIILCQADLYPVDPVDMLCINKKIHFDLLDA